MDGGVAKPVSMLLNFVTGGQLNIFLNKRFHFRGPAYSTVQSRG